MHTDHRLSCEERRAARRALTQRVLAGDISLEDYATESNRLLLNMDALALTLAKCTLRRKAHQTAEASQEAGAAPAPLAAMS